MILSARRSETCLCIHDWINIIEYPEDMYHVFRVSWDFPEKYNYIVGMIDTLEVRSSVYRYFIMPYCSYKS